jgi:5-hydroxyisourate hydrolase-like protein (transthyretin family)
MSVSHVTTHVLDTGTGRPAAGVAVVLFQHDGGTWRRLAASTTDADGRATRAAALEPVRVLHLPGQLTPPEFLST